MPHNENDFGRGDGLFTSVIGVGLLIVGLLVLAAVIFGGIAASKSFNRYQQRADANNQVEINSIIIRQQEQRVLIQQQDSQIAIEEARGIAEAQRIIDESLTPEYLTYHAIKAQMEMADSPNNTTIYIPVGTNGIPFVLDAGVDE